LCIAIASFGLMAYAHAGYPLLIWSLGRLWPRPLGAGPITPRVALIIAAYNEAAVIAAKVANSLALDYPPDLLRIVVVCDGSTDDTASTACAAGGSRVTVLHGRERSGKGAALNRGVDATDEPILVFSDANAMYRSNALRSLVAAFNNPAVGLASGFKMVTRESHVVGDGEGAYWSYESLLRRAETATGSTVAVVGEMLAIRRECFARIPAHVISDDVYLCMSVLRAAYRVVFVPEAVSVERSSATHAAEIVRRRRLAVCRFELLFSPRRWPWRQPFVLFELFSHKFLRLLAPWLLLGGFVSTLVLAWRPGAPAVTWAIVAAQAGFYTLATVGACDMATGFLRRPARVAAYVVAGHVAIAVGAILYLTGNAPRFLERVARRPGVASE
jgi:poly-beta-1,6-N-acetyl-D-glucosamine synthase